MKFQEELLHSQPMVYNTFVHALREQKLSHAYLIKGNEGSPLLETAKFLAKTLICDAPDPLACETCMSCIRFDEGNYADFMLLDGSKSNIKVGDIEALQSFFQNTASETCGKMIYIIHLLENSNREALNALLKFLEEPADNVYAFLTTQNEERLLPTILSRTQHLKLLPLPREHLLKVCTDAGVSDDDAELLSCFYGNADTLIAVASKEQYRTIKDSVFDTLNMLRISPGEALYFVQSQLIPVLKDKASVRLYLDILSVAFRDIYNDTLHLPPILKSQAELIHALSASVPKPDAYYLEIMLARGRLESNVNPGLLLEHIFIQLYKGE